MDDMILLLDDGDARPTRKRALPAGGADGPLVEHVTVSGSCCRQTWQTDRPPGWPTLRW